MKTVVCPVLHLTRYTIGTVPSCACTYVHVRNGIVHVNLGHLGRVDIPVGQVSLHSRLPEGQEIR